MKIILFTDSHFTNNNTDHNNKLKEFFNYMVDYAINNNINTAIFAGDAFENKKMINIGAFDDCYSAFLKLSLQVDTHAIGGNHDNITINSNQYSLKPFKAIMSVYLKPKTITLDDKTFLFLPFGFNLEDYYKNQDYVICHTEIKNAKYGNKICENGINISKYPNTFFINGHLHLRQEMDNCLIVGSPIYKDFGDNINVEKGFYVLDTNTNKYEFISYKSPKYITIKANNDKEYLSAKALIEEDTYNHYRLELTYNKMVDITNNVDIKYNIKTDDNNFDLKLTTDINSTINDYIHKSNTELNKDKLKSIVNKYMKEI